MAIEKYTTSEKFEVLRGEEAQVLHEHRQKLGKSSVADFDKEELEALERDLTRVAKATKEDDEQTSNRNKNEKDDSQRARTGEGSDS